MEKKKFKKMPYISTGIQLMTIILISIIMVIIIMPSQDYCKPYPIGYEKTGSYCIETMCACLYETPANQPFNQCVEEYETTKNHGLIKRLSTCKRLDLNYPI